MLQTFGLVIPIFAVIAMGWLAKRRKLLDLTGLAALNGFAYWVALPSLLFASIADIEVKGAIGVAGIYLACCLAVYACAAALSGLIFRRSLAAAAMFALNSTYGNVIYMGTPLISAAFGRQGVSLIVAIIALHSGVLLTLTAALIEVGSRSPDSTGAVLHNMAASLVKNPIIMSIVVGLIWRLTALELPSPLHNLLTLLGNAAAPLALFCLGASLPTAGRLSLTPEVALAAIIKLIVLPSAVGAVAWTIGLPDLPWRVAVLTAAVPTGANAILLARRANQFSESSAHTVVLATAVSVLTITALLSWLH